MTLLEAIVDIEEKFVGISSYVNRNEFNHARCYFGGDRKNE